MKLAERAKDLRRVPSSYRFKRFRTLVAPKPVATNISRRLSGQRLVVILGSAHRVGSTWFTQMLEDLVGFEYEFENRRVPRVCRGFSETIALEAPATRDFVAEAKGFRFFKTHSRLEWDQIPDHVKFISVHRDPRDVVVSTVFHLDAMPPEDGGFRPELRGLSFREKLIDVLESEYQLALLEHWYRHPEVHQVRYEEARANVVDSLQAIVEYLGLSIDRSRIEEIAGWHSFQRRSGRAPGALRADSGMRKGIVGDWTNYFDEDVRRCFKEVHGGRWNELLVEMGYEASGDW